MVDSAPGRPAADDGHPAARQAARAPTGPNGPTSSTGPTDATGPTGPTHATASNGRPAREPGRRGVLTATAAAGLGLLTACAGKSDGDAAPAGAAPPRTADAGKSSPSPGPARKRPQLPRGGRELFPRHRLVGFCGLPGFAALGRLGTGGLDERAREIEKLAHTYAADREPLPVLELLAVVANAEPGSDGTYRSRTSADTVRRFHAAARKHRALLLLNIQPGRASALGEVKALREWLVHPDVGIALDPEWEMGPGETPGDTYGSTDGRELTEIARYLSGLVHEHDLPEKPFIFHQVAGSVVRDQYAFRPQPGVAAVKCADGIGSPGLKRETWNHLVRKLPQGMHTGFKLFYDEDTEGSRLMTHKEVLALRPQPEYIMYE
ncbi:hypothetical protein ACH4FX_03665 [Streptomyces sp. NPDC018019]|uniref:hypothetical protein n=1 Tax=Streptomyces sp. NPDC018019 TaxID=3365030 RepID=UPI0037A9EA89